MTRAISCKDAVRLKTLTPAFVFGMLALQTMLAESVCPADGLVITSLNDSTHAPTSRHYTGEAWDLRVHAFSSDRLVQRFAELYQERLGEQFTILYESPSTANAHLHVQVKMGHAFRWDHPRAAALSALLASR